MSAYPTGLASLQEALLSLESNNPANLTPAEVGSGGVGGASLYMDPNFQGTAAKQLGIGPSSPGQSQQPGILDGAKKAAKAAWDTVNGFSFLGSLFGIDSQAVTVLVGLILIAGGIFLFKPVQQVVVSTVKEAAKAGTVAA